MQNFGNINNAFNEVLIDGIIKKDKTKKEVYKKYLKALKENKILKTQYLIYKNLETKVESDINKATEYVNENISLLAEFSKDDIKKANKEIINLLGENSKLLKADYPRKDLHENISFLINNKKTSSNIDKILECKHSITEHIITNKEKEPVSESIVPTKVLAELIGKKFNEKYSTLDESTKNILKVIIESDEEKQKTFFKESITNCINLVDESLKNQDTNTKEKLLKVKDKLLRMEYNNEEFPQEIVKLINLEKALKD